MVRAAPKRFPALPQKIGHEQQRVAGRNQQSARQLALAGDHHEQRPVDEERRPEAGAAEGDQPGQPQPRLRDEAADIGERIGRPRLARPDRLVVAQPVVQNSASKAIANTATAPCAA